MKACTEFHAYEGMLYSLVTRSIQLRNPQYNSPNQQALCKTICLPSLLSESIMRIAAQQDQPAAIFICLELSLQLIYIQFLLYIDMLCSSNVLSCIGERVNNLTRSELCLALKGPTYRPDVGGASVKCSKKAGRFPTFQLVGPVYESSQTSRLNIRWRQSRGASPLLPRTTLICLVVCSQQPSDWLCDSSTQPLRRHF